MIHGDGQAAFRGAHAPRVWLTAPSRLAPVRAIAYRGHSRGGALGAVDGGVHRHSRGRLCSPKLSTPKLCSPNGVSRLAAGIIIRWVFFFDWISGGARVLRFHGTVNSTTSLAGLSPAELRAETVSCSTTPAAKCGKLWLVWLSATITFNASLPSALVTARKR